MNLQDQQLNGGLKPRPSKLELRKLSGLLSKEDGGQEQKGAREQREKRGRKKKQMRDNGHGRAKKDGAPLKHQCRQQGRGSLQLCRYKSGNVEIMSRSVGIA